MRKILLIMSMVMCSLYANAQQLEPNYHYSFWSNWSIGAGAVYSKPFDLGNWAFADGGNVGLDARLEKALSNAWTLRLDACIPGLKDTGYDRYGTALAGVNLNVIKNGYVYLFADGGVSFKKWNVGNVNHVWLTADYGLGTNIPIGEKIKVYGEVGSDCASYICKENSKLFAKVGLLYILPNTEKDYTNISIIHNNKQGVSQNEYDKLVAEKEECSKTLDNTMAELDKMRKCCNANNEKYEQEILELKEALANHKETNATIPFSVLFDRNSTNISKEAKEIISQVAIEINKDGGNYTLYGFGDYTGSESYNEVLSGARCESVKNELVKNGVDENKINTVGLGKSQHFGSPESYVNRRVMFVKD